MIEADLLARELRGRPPHVRVSEPLAPIAVDRVAHHADVRILLHDHRIRHVRLFALRLQEDAHEPEGRVNLVLQPREADALLRGDRDELPSRELRLELLHIVRGDEVDLVHDDERPQEHPVPCEDVDELVFRDVLPHDDRAVQVAPLPANVRDHLRVELRQLDRRIHREPAAVSLRQRDVRGALVQPDPGEMQFVREDIDMGLEHVDHQQDQVAGPGDGEDLLPAPAAFRCPADETGHVEHLDLRPAVLHEAGDHVQRREVVCGDLARRVRNLIEEGRLADAREADEADRRVPALLDRVARTAPAPLEAPRLLFVLEPREFGLQPPDVVLGRLVVRRLLDLVLDRLNLFLDRHAMRNRAGRTTKNLSTPTLRGLFESDLVPLRVPEGRNPTEALRSNWGHVDLSARELADHSLDVLDQELHVPAVAPVVRPAFRMKGDGATPATEVYEVRVLVGDRKAERFVIEGSHPIEFADPEEYRFELRIGQGTGDRFGHRVTRGYGGAAGKASLSATTPCECLRAPGL